MGAIKYDNVTRILYYTYRSASNKTNPNKIVPIYIPILVLYSCLCG